MLSIIHGYTRWCLIVSGLLFLGLHVSPTGQALAHPHVFLETEIEIEFNEQGLKGIWQEWTFDEYQSSWIINQYNIDQEGEISSQELDRLYRETFENLKHYNFFTMVMVGDEKIPATKIENFSVKVKDGLAIYSFFVPFDMEINQDKQEVFILVYDETYFCHVFFPPDNIGFKGDLSSWEINYSTQKKSSLRFYFGMVTPEAIKLSIAPL